MESFQPNFGKYKNPKPTGAPSLLPPKKKSLYFTKTELSNFNIKNLKFLLETAFLIFQETKNPQKFFVCH